MQCIIYNYLLKSCYTTATYGWITCFCTAARQQSIFVFYMYSYMSMPRLVWPPYQYMCFDAIVNTNCKEVCIHALWSTLLRIASWQYLMHLRKDRTFVTLFLGHIRGWKLHILIIYYVSNDLSKHHHRCFISICRNIFSIYVVSLVAVHSLSVLSASSSITISSQ